MNGGTETEAAAELMDDHGVAGMSFAEVLRDRQFYLIYLSSFGAAVLSLMAFVHLPQQLAESGRGQMQAATNVSVIGLFSLAARLGGGAWADRIGRVAMIRVALVIMLLVFAALAFTRIGKAMRASADNPELASLKGIRPQRVASMASFVGMGLVGIGGMLLGLDSSIDPLTGTRILLSLFAAAVLGGLGSAPGAVLGAFLIGIAEELSVLVVGSPYRAAVGFVAILVMLTVRPRGLLGERAV